MNLKRRPEKNTPGVIIVTGPTASGKTSFSELIIEKLKTNNNIFGEVINADVGQLYTPLSIGTAKPDLDTLDYPTHGFNLIDIPQDLSASKYRLLVNSVVKSVSRKKNVPIIVGGSLFYIKSLFYPTKDFNEFVNREITIINKEKDGLWEQLNEIDPVRAKQIHPNDKYRVGRALEIWNEFGIKPSLCKPEFNPEFKALIVFVMPDQEILDKNIRLRFDEMLLEGWIEETEKLLGTDWEIFLKRKNIIGYPELIEWVKQGHKKSELERVANIIKSETVAYSKRQKKFWQNFVRQLEESEAQNTGWVKIEEIHSRNNYQAEEIIKEYLGFCN